MDAWVNMHSTIMPQRYGGDVAVEPIETLKCFCSHYCPPESVETRSCEVKVGGRCFASVEETFNTETGLLEPEYGYGCLAADDTSLLQCRGDLVDHAIPTSIECCYDGDFCNKYLSPTYKPSNISDYGLYDPSSEEYLLKLLLAAVVIFLMLTFLIVLYIVCKYRSRERNPKYIRDDLDSNKSCLLSPQPTIKDRFIDVDVDQSSGSGSGMPQLVQRTLGKQIAFKNKIGKGRYGDVYLGEWKGTHVAVKTVYTKEEAAWWREQSIYKMALIKHPNILVSMGWDIRSVDDLTQMIIVTDYHPRGSLYDYLQGCCLTEDEAYKIMYSAISGLCHLHTEVEGKPYKQGIAHRDLKSKNILVKNDGETCIADFGMAVCSVSGKKGVDMVPNIKSGTKRYMAPELLDETMKTEWFEAYKQADMYSFSLILWEVGRRCVTNSGGEKVECEEYAVPFDGFVRADPSFEDMKKVVCDLGFRPEIPTRWGKSKLLREVSSMLKECWHRSPQVRLSALRVKKTLSALAPYNEKKWELANLS